MYMSEEIVTRQDASKIVRQLVKLNPGIDEGDLVHRGDIAMEELERMKIIAALLQAWESGQVKMNVVDGEVTWEK
jgi:hypothetical protein